jgi:hypothetical protein
MTMKFQKPKVSTSEPTRQSSKSSVSTTTGTPTQPAKRFGIVSFHEGELHSKPDSDATMSFSYFRTKTGLPPEVEAKRRDDAKK